MELVEKLLKSEVAEKATPSISSLNAPNIDLLTEGQKEAFWGIYNAFQQGEKIVTLCARAGSGKMQPNHSKVFTPSGVTTIGELKVGDEVLNHEGKPTKVLGVFPKTNLDIYKITLSDGSQVEACKDHLWEVQRITQRGDNYMIKTTKELLEDFDKYKGTKAGYTYSIRSVQASHTQKELLLHPYLLGIIIGDAYIPETGKVTISCNAMDVDETFERLKLLCPSIEFKTYKQFDNVVRIACPAEVKQHLATMGLLGAKSADKFIPNDYLYSSVADRKYLLAGLLDTDGTVGGDVNEKKRKIRYCTISFQLATQVKQLVCSLGGICSINKSDRTLNGKGIEYNLNIRLPFNPFLRTYKKEKLGEYKNTFKFSRKIIAIDYIGKMDGRCIMVECPRHLYLTDNYILTHNTYMLNVLINHLLWEYRHSQEFTVAVTAPTTKAVKVLRNKCEFNSQKMQFMTVQSLLGLREQKTPDGNIVFVPMAGKSKIGGFSVVIVDEASMVGSDLLGMLIDYAVKTPEFFIVFSGDSWQLNPVNEKDSPVFVQGFPEFTLKKPIRQAADNPLFEVINAPLTYLWKKGSNKDDMGWASIEKTELLPIATQLFKSPQFARNSDFVRVLAWTNKAVDFINDYIRKQLFGNDVGSYAVGERLVVKEPYIVDDRPVLSVNDEVEIVNISTGVVTLFEQKYKIYWLELSYYNNMNILSGATVPVLHEDSKQIFAESLEAISEAAKEYAYNDHRRVDMWKVYYSLKGEFAWLKPAYAMTVHTSQGSTFRNTIIAGADLNKNFSGKEKTRLWYTALTRASHFCFIAK